MQSKNKEFPIDIGSVSIGLRKGRFLRLRWTIGGKQDELSYGSYTQEHLDAAITTAHILNRDLTCDNYDWTKAKYQPPWKKVAPISNNTVITQSKEITLLELWEQYRDFKEKSVSASTSKSDWNTVRRAFDRYISPDLTINDCEDVITTLLEVYSLSTTRRVCEYIRASIKEAIAREQIAKDPMSRLIAVLLPKNKQEIRAFTPLDLEAILVAFSDDRYLIKGVKYKHSHYWHYVRFRTLCGCRPSEAIAWLFTRSRHLD